MHHIESPNLGLTLVSDPESLTRSGAAPTSPAKAVKSTWDLATN